MAAELELVHHSWTDPTTVELVLSDEDGESVDLTVCIESDSYGSECARCMGDASPEAREWLEEHEDEVLTLRDEQRDYLRDMALMGGMGSP